MTGALVLAAGISRRYGYTNKLLAPIDGAPLLAHTLRGLNRTALYPIVVVTGRDHRAIGAIARGRVAPAARLRVVRNRDYRRGQSGSLRTGLAALPHACNAVLVCLGDMPGIDAALVRRVLRGRAPGVHAVRPVYAGRPGHPVWLSRALFTRLHLAGADDGAKHILATLPAGRRRTIAGPRACIADIDTPESLRDYAKRRALTPRKRRATHPRP